MPRLLVVAYALSPIDLIAGFIPLPGYLDDVLLLAACRARFYQWLAVRDSRLRGGACAVVVVVIRIGTSVGVGIAFSRQMPGGGHCFLQWGQKTGLYFRSWRSGLVKTFRCQTRL